MTKHYDSIHSRREMKFSYAIQHWSAIVHFIVI